MRKGHFHCKSVGATLAPTGKFEVAAGYSRSAGTDEVSLAHEFVAEMLGVQRISSDRGT